MCFWLSPAKRTELHYPYGIVMWFAIRSRLWVLITWLRLGWELPPGASISLKAFNENSRVTVSLPALCDFIAKKRIADEWGWVDTWCSPWGRKNTELTLFILAFKCCSNCIRCAKPLPLKGMCGCTLGVRAGCKTHVPTGLRKHRTDTTCTSFGLFFCGKVFCWVYSTVFTPCLLRCLYGVSQVRMFLKKVLCKEFPGWGGVAITSISLS